MAVSLSDKPNDDKPAAAPAAPAQSAKADKKEEKLDVNDSRLNNQTNVYGQGPDGPKTVQQEVEEKRAERIAKINEASADVLSGAAASSNADVHNLLGQRAIAELNADEDELKRIDQEIAEGQKQTSR